MWQTQLTSFRDYNWLRQVFVSRQIQRVSNTPRDAEQDLRSCVQWCLEKAHQSQGGAANSTRPTTANLGLKVSSSPAHRGSEHSTRRLESTKKRATAVSLDVKIDESTMRVDEESLEMSLEMTQQSELATGARGSDARSCDDLAGKTPRMPPTGRSAKGGNGRVVPADHEAPGQHMQPQLQESQVADVHVRHVTAEKGNGLPNQGTLSQNKASEHDRGEQRADVGVKAPGNKARHNVPAELAPVPRTGVQARTSKEPRLTQDEKSSMKRAQQFLW